MSLYEKISFASGCDENGPFYEISQSVKSYQVPIWSIKLNLNDLMELMGLIHGIINQKAKLWEHRNFEHIKNRNR